MRGTQKPEIVAEGCAGVRNVNVLNEQLSVTIIRMLMIGWIRVRWQSFFVFFTFFAFSDFIVVIRITNKIKEVWLVGWICQYIACCVLIYRNECFSDTIYIQRNALMWICGTIGARVSVGWIFVVLGGFYTLVTLLAWFSVIMWHVNRLSGVFIRFFGRFTGLILTIEV